MIGAGWLRVPGLIALAAALVLVLLAASRDAEAVPAFSPKASACLDNFATATACDGDNAPGASADISGGFCVGKTLPGSLCADGGATDSNFGGVVTFTPPEWFIAKAGDMPIGAVVGRLTSKAQLGLLNGPCSNNINVAFTLQNASVNKSDTIDPLPPDTTEPEGVMTPLAGDTNNNGIFDGIDKYPSFLDDDDTFQGLQPIARFGGFSRIQGQWISLQFVYFDKTGDFTPPKTFLPDELFPFSPNLGYVSITVLQDPTTPINPSPITDFCSPLISANTAFATSLNNPCTPQQNPILPGCPKGPQLAKSESAGAPFGACDDAINSDGIEGLSDDTKVNDGCPQVNNIAETGAECDNNISDDGEDANVNDGCPQAGQYSEAGLIPDPDGCDTDTNEASCDVRKNPDAAGTYNFVVFAGSQRDFDGDGIENSLDVCWADANPNWNPRAVDPTDPDGDGIPNECDPAPNTKSPNSGCEPMGLAVDEDLDCYPNRQDNCPLDANDQTDSDSDGIGDVCDTAANGTKGPDVPDGEPVLLCVVTEVDIGGGGTPASIKYPPCAALDIIEGEKDTDDSTGGDDTTDGTDGTDGTGGDVEGAEGGPTSGVGALAPAASSIPAWATIASGLGGAGLLGSLGAFAARFLRIRRRTDE